jgi:RNA polymerase sigma factor (sigma-70 family)
VRASAFVCATAGVWLLHLRRQTRRAADILVLPIRDNFPLGIGGESNFAKVCKSAQKSPNRLLKISRERSETGPEMLDAKPTFHYRFRLLPNRGQTMHTKSTPTSLTAQPSRQRVEKAMLSDEELMAHLVRRDQTALESLYDRHSKLLYSTALRITGDSGSAEELLQDTFFLLWQKASQFDEARGSLIGWLLAITRHRAISRIRQRSGRFRCESLCEETIPPQNAGPSILEQQIARELVSAALAGLPQEQLKAVTLAYFDGLTCEEIAVRTEAPLGTTKSRLRSALKTMKKALSNSNLTNSPGPASVAATLESILITEQLHSRSCRERRAEQEAESLRTLARVIAASPQDLVDAFLKIPLDLCRAGTAGLSLLETNASGEQVFRWTNLSGKLSNCVGGTTPRNFSPCGVTLDRNSPQLFSYPARYFQYFNQVDVPIVEGLVIPFYAGPKTEGTIWIVSHDEQSRFDSEDARIMTSLAEFTGCALHLTRSSDLAQGQ